MFLRNKQQKEGFEMMKEALIEASMKEIGNKIITEGKEYQKKLNDELCVKVDDLEKMIRAKLDEIVIKKVKEILANERQ